MQIITTTQELEAFCASLASEPYITVDTEFMRERTFWPVLCLIQVAAPDKVALIDPLAEGIDLAPLYGLMRNPEVVKVFHAARQDLEIFWNLSQCIPTPMFDTQVAAMALGYGENAAYNTLARELLGETLDKSQQYTHWDRRPLSESQITYAAADVTHLCKIYEILKDKLEEKGRSSWIEAEMQALTNPALYQPKPDEAFRRIKHQLRKPEQLAVLQALAAWREEESPRRDMPRQRVLKDESLVEIAKQLPKNAEALLAVRNLRRMSDSTANVLISIVQETLAAPIDPDIARQKRGEPSPDADLVGMLSLLLKICCREAEVSPKLVATRSDLDDIARGKEDAPALHGWRGEVFGNQARSLLQGSLTLSWDDTAKNIQLVSGGGQ